MLNVITNGQILAPSGDFRPGSLIMKDGRILAIVPDPQPAGLNEATTFDAKGQAVIPGFIDGHTHGGVGFDYMTCSQPELEKLLTWLPSTGVSGVLPTISSSPLEEEVEMITRLAAAWEQPSPGATILGLHLEGPFLNPGKRGAQPGSPIRNPNLDEMKRMVEAGRGAVRLVTLAPELPGALELIAWLAAQGIVVSAGHSEASYEQMVSARDAGLTRVAHLYNGMSPFHHREPGVIGAALELDNLYTELILDGMHISFAAARLAIKARGLRETVIISDSTQAAGLGEGIYIRPGNRKIIVSEGAARLESGQLAGSILTLDRAVNNAVQHVGLTLGQAANLAGRNAAESLQLAGRGQLLPGFAADVLVVDHSVHIQAAFVAGKRVH